MRQVIRHGNDNKIDKSTCVCIYIYIYMNPRTKTNVYIMCI